MSREIVACVTRQPAAASASLQLELRADPLARDQAADQSQPLTLAELSVDLHTVAWYAAWEDGGPKRAASP